MCPYLLKVWQKQHYQRLCACAHVLCLLRCSYLEVEIWEDGIEMYPLRCCWLPAAPEESASEFELIWENKVTSSTVFSNNQDKKKGFSVNNIASNLKMRIRPLYDSFTFITAATQDRRPAMQQAVTFIFLWNAYLSLLLMAVSGSSLIHEWSSQSNTF